MEASPEEVTLHMGGHGGGAVALGPLVIDEVLSPEARVADGWTTHLEVPLRLRDERDLDLFEGGVLAERSRYSLRLELSASEPVRGVTLCVNDGQDLQMHEHPGGGAASLPHRLPHPYVFTYGPEDAQLDHHNPFQLSTGFSRADVTVELQDGTELVCHSQDVVTLSAEVRENLEDEGILDELLHSTMNQAAEWMFSQPGDTAPGGRALSSDASTDWADDSIDSCSHAVQASLALVSQGLGCQTDGFPASANGSYDTPENRLVRAFLASMVAQTTALTAQLKAEEERAEGLLARIDALVRLGAARYSGGQGPQLPARTIFEARGKHIGARRRVFEELAARASTSLAEFDRVAPGVASVGFAPPKGTGAFASNAAYRQLREAMRYWRQFAGYRYTREYRELHVLKPDRLYEYYCLYRLLDGLYGLGFTERIGADGPAIGFFDYSIEDDYDLYENEARCANTYRLARRIAGGAWQEVDLYYVPVVYGDLREENGICLHKLNQDGTRYNPRSARQSIWTPDFLLVLRQDGRPSRTFVMDAKHLDLMQALKGWTYGGRGLYDKLCQRYLDRMGGGNGQMPCPREVWLLCAYGNVPSWTDDRGRGGLFRLDTQTTDGQLDRFLVRLGMERG